MGQLLVRGLDDEVVTLLRQRASANGRSVEAEHRAIFEAAVRPEGEPIWLQAQRVRERIEAETGGLGSDSAEVIRHHRDTRMTGRGES